MVYFFLGHFFYGWWTIVKLYNPSSGCLSMEATHVQPRPCCCSVTHSPGRYKQHANAHSNGSSWHFFISVVELIREGKVSIAQLCIYLCLSHERNFIYSSRLLVLLFHKLLFGVTALYILNILLSGSEKCRIFFAW